MFTVSNYWEIFTTFVIGWAILIKLINDEVADCTVELYFTEMFIPSFMTIQCKYSAMFFMIFFLGSTFSHKMSRFQGQHGLTYEKAEFERAVEYFDSIAGCAAYCNKINGNE